MVSSVSRTGKTQVDSDPDATVPGGGGPQSSRGLDTSDDEGVSRRESLDRDHVETVVGRRRKWTSPLRLSPSCKQKRRKESKKKL